METAKILLSVATVLVALASFIVARRSDVRSKKAESIKNLLGEKETVAFAALKLLQDGLPKNRRDRKLVVSGIIQACVFERSDRARALLYRVIEKNRDVYGDELEEALASIKKTFDKMDLYKFHKKELDLGTGRTRIAAVDKVINPRNTERNVGRPCPSLRRHMNDRLGMDSKTHIEMWKHYDNLRQAKNSGFLTTNSILVAIVGFLLRDPRLFVFSILIVLIGIVGLAVCISWFLLLTRNYEYIKHHRDHAPGGYWHPGNRLLPGSRWTERTPSAAFVVLWIGVLVFVTIHQ